MALREEVPREFSDDARWYKFFTNQMFAAILIIVFLGRILYSVLGIFHLELLSIIITIIALITAMALICLPIPKGDLMGGAGLNLGKVLMRLYIHRKRNKTLYIKGYKKGE